jgi:mono/diheme cytochrome c family protein
MKELLARGQDRYNIYCTPCHSRIGDGNGMVVQRGLKHPPSFHEPRLKQSPLAYFYDVDTNGFGAMLNYKAQINTADRWAIAAYIRALQLSQDAKMSDVPESERSSLQVTPEHTGTTVERSKQNEQGGPR